MTKINIDSFTKEGTITPALLVTISAFLIVIYGLLSVVSLQFDFSDRQLAQEKALNTAEAGINYYRWHLAHDPDDFFDGTESEGVYEHEYIDPQGNSFGKFSLDIDEPSVGSSVVTIRSTGWVNEFQNIKRTITVQYGKPSFAEFSFLSNASSWYGNNITVSGQIHSNNGIRMDGTNLSLVQSAQETYICGDETGCYNSSYCFSPCSWNWFQHRCYCPGIWGSGGDDGLWEYPETTINFESIALDFDDLQDEAEDVGLYLAETTEARGYHIIFSGSSFNVYRITSTNYYQGYTPDDNCQRRYERISNQNLIGTYNVSDRPIIFSEEDLWVEGEIDGRVTIIAARFPIDSNALNIWINSNLTYTAYDKTNSLGLIAQNDIYFTRDIPEDFRVDGALMALNGKIIRHGYISGCGYSSTHSVKESLTIYGSLISYNKSYWNFGSSPSSGFKVRNISYDPNLYYFPPPFFPTTGEYEFISWVED
jgi:hypothetical protein